MKGLFEMSDGSGEVAFCCGRNDDGMLISDEFFYGFKRKAHVGAEFLDG